MTELTRDAILAASDLPVLALEVPEWGGQVFIRTLTGAERDRFEKRIQSGTMVDVRASWAALVVCSSNGAPLFTPADIEALAAKSSVPLTRVLEAAASHNEISKEDEEELAKN